MFYLLQDSLIFVGFGLNMLVQIHSESEWKRWSNPPEPTQMEPVSYLNHLRDLLQGNRI